VNEFDDRYRRGSHMRLGCAGLYDLARENHPSEWI